MMGGRGGVRRKCYPSLNRQRFDKRRIGKHSGGLGAISKAIIGASGDHCRRFPSITNGAIIAPEARAYLAWRWFGLKADLEDKRRAACSAASKIVFVRYHLSPGRCVRGCGGCTAFTAKNERKTSCCCKQQVSNWVWGGGILFPIGSVLARRSFRKHLPFDFARFPLSPW